MPYTEQQLQCILHGPEVLRNVIRENAIAQMEEAERKRKEEIMAQPQIPSEEESHKALQELALRNTYHNVEMHPRPHIDLNPQPFYTKFLNKRNKNKRKK